MDGPELWAPRTRIARQPLSLSLSLPRETPQLCAKRDLRSPGGYFRED